MIELKARIEDQNDIRKKLSNLGAEYKGSFLQIDHYFNVPEGRLKLRTVENSDIAELIFYERENIEGPKIDEAFIIRIQDQMGLKNILKRILKTYIVVEKNREIHLYQGTRIHLDKVKKLGNFIEFERQTIDDPNRINNDQLILRKLMRTLGITEDNLESFSYSDLLASGRYETE